MAIFNRGRTLSTLPTAFLGLAVYPENQVWPNVVAFVASARRNSPTSEIVLITSPLGSRDRAEFQRHGVSSLPLADPSPVGHEADPEHRQLRKQWVMSLYAKRHLHYAHALEQMASRHVLLTDTRDVVVAGELSALGAGRNLLLAQENVTLSLGSEPTNRSWIVKCYGQEEMERLHERRILCAGTVYGPSDALLVYVREMSQEFMRVGIVRITEFGDQPVHNYLAYSGRLPVYEVSTAEAGGIKTIGLLPKRRFMLGWVRDSLALRARQKTVIYHQYDRHMNSRVFRWAFAHASADSNLQSYSDHQ
ncbi:MULTISPECIES: hypothetical protein [Aphanothece]|uniref:hypothetical protein n=1 Tax=Aphanothece TaxID=1121 RepID=UPI00398F7D83